MAVSTLFARYILFRLDPLFSVLKKILARSQIISCSEHWTKGMQSILDQVMKTPCLFISSCLEAAIYGGMKLDVQHGTSSEMDSSLLKLVQEKRTTRTIVFCRSSDEIAKLQDMLSTVLRF